MGIENTIAVKEKLCLGEWITFKDNPQLGEFEPAFSVFDNFFPLNAETNPDQTTSLCVFVCVWPLSPYKHDHFEIFKIVHIIMSSYAF